MSLSGTYQPYSFYSFVKCVDAFRISLTEEPKLVTKQKPG